MGLSQIAWSGFVVLCDARASAREEAVATRPVQTVLREVIPGLTAVPPLRHRAAHRAAGGVLVRMCLSRLAGVSGIVTMSVQAAP